MIITAANTVSRPAPSSRAAGQHQRDDERDLDHGDGDREHHRAERLAHAVRDDLRVVNGRQHAADQAGATTTIR
jgi:hypothetical protein